jgi:hypothetical protein
LIFTLGAASSPNYVMPTGYTFLVPPNEQAANQTFAQSGLFPNGSGGATGGNSAMFSLGNAGQPPGGGAIAVEAGASITSTRDSAGNGGNVVLMGTKVANAGSVATQNGQIILAAASSVILGQPFTTDTGVNTAYSVTPVQPGNNPTRNHAPYPKVHLPKSVTCRSFNIRDLLQSHPWRGSQAAFIYPFSAERIASRNGAAVYSDFADSPAATLLQHRGPSRLHLTTISSSVCPPCTSKVNNSRGSHVGEWS